MVIHQATSSILAPSCRTQRRIGEGSARGRSAGRCRPACVTHPRAPRPPAATGEAAAGAETLVALLDRVQARIGEITEQMVTAFRAGIAEYTTMSPGLEADIRAICTANLQVWLASAQMARPPEEPDLARFAASARQRARQGFPLDGLLHAYRLGARIGWDVIRDEGRGLDAEVTLDLAGGLMRYVDLVSTQVAQAYLEESERLLTDVERHHREVAEALLAGGVGAHATIERATRAEVRLAETYWVALVRAPRHAAEPARGPHPGEPARGLVRRLRAEPGVLAVRYTDEVLVLLPGDPGVPDRLVALVGPTVPVALAGPAGTGLDQLVREARAVLAAAHLRGLTGRVGLDAVPLEAYLLGAGDAAAAALIARVDQLDEPSGRVPTRLLETLRAYLAHDGSLEACATAMYVHRNTVTYRLRRIRERTGLDPTRMADLAALSAGLLLRDAAEGAGRLGRRQGPAGDDDAHPARPRATR